MKKMNKKDRNKLIKRILMEKERPLKDLIETSNCGIKCKGKSYEFKNCYCELCSAFDIFSEDDMKKRFTKKEIDKIDSLRDKNTSFYRKGEGCVLSRELRPIVCLRFICKEAILGE